MAARLPKKTIIQDATQNKDINVWAQENLRWLEFGDGVIQTVIDIDEPDRLPSPVNRAMLAALMFIDAPRRVLLAGGGGGAIARYFHGRCDDIDGVAVEVSGRVASIARRFFEIPDKFSRWKLVVLDIRDYLRETTGEFDLILVDVAEGSFTPDWIYGSEFLELCRQKLSLGGVVAINLLVSEAETFSAALQTIRHLFQRRTVCLSIEDYRNIMVFAFSDCILFEETQRIKGRISELESKWGLEFTKFISRMHKDNPVGSGVF